MIPASYYAVATCCNLMHTPKSAAKRSVFTVWTFIKKKVVGRKDRYHFLDCSTGMHSFGGCARCM